MDHEELVSLANFCRESRERNSIIIALYLMESRKRQVKPSRLTCDKLENNDLWWAGPRWLQSREITQQSVDEASQSEEDFIEKYSSISRMERLLSYCLHFIRNRRKQREERVVEGLKISEINSAKELLLQHVQEISFTEEIKELRRGQPMKKSSKLLSLTPFLDKSGLIKGGGRIQESSVSFQERHQILLPDKHRLTKLLVEREHLRLFHVGPQALLSAVRMRYWPLNGRNLVRQIYHECLVCYRANPTPASQIMGALPKTRVQPSRPFFVTGVDFTGPIVTLVNKARGRKTNKLYIALFICFATKAIHLEAASELTTAAFLATLRRFTVRRVRPQKLHSDNGTNFVGANRELQEVFEFIRKEVKASKLHEFCSENNIQWSFISARFPLMGGLWEVGMKSCKFHRKRVTRQLMFTFEELATVLTQIEAILNSRPLTPMSSDPADLQPLTPGHFLVGEPLTSVPNANVLDVKLNRLNRWQVIQRNIQEFWKR